MCRQMKREGYEELRRLKEECCAHNTRLYNLAICLAVFVVVVCFFT